MRQLSANIDVVDLRAYPAPTSRGISRSVTSAMQSALAEHGADVLKITASHIAARDDQEYDTGHGKLSARLDLRQPNDLDTREADVFSQGYRSGTLGNRGLSPEELARLRPGLVHVSLCAFSHKGP